MAHRHKKPPAGSGIDCPYARALVHEELDLHGQPCLSPSLRKTWWYRLVLRTGQPFEFRRVRRAVECLAA